MPWPPRFVSARHLAVYSEPQARVPYFEGLVSGDPEELSRAFAGEPEVHHPVRGRVKGRDEFMSFVTQQAEWMTASAYAVTPVDLIVTPARTVEEVVLSFDGDRGRVDLPVAIVTERVDAGIVEMRIYFSTWPITGSHANRPPLLQPRADVHESDVVGDYQRALADGDLEATLAVFEQDASVREPAGEAYTHRGAAGLREMYTAFFSNGGGIPLEHCTATDDGRACALEYNVTQWGRTPLPPEAGIAVYVRGASGLLSAARIYDDSDPPIG